MIAIAILRGIRVVDRNSKSKLRIREAELGRLASGGAKEEFFKQVTPLLGSTQGLHQNAG